MAALSHPVIIEIDKENWKQSLDRAERWFHFVQTVQTSFRKLAEDTQPKMHDSHLRDYLTEITTRAREHETKAAELLRLIGREPKSSHNLTGTLFAKAREVTADLEGFMGGAASGWRDLSQLVHASLDGITAFGVANDIGLALGLVEVTDLTLEVTGQKYIHHYLLQEITLELGSLSVLYRTEP
ncbi:MAG: hypothetical protein ACRYFU_23820 [Janthinobacterium lividum]